MPVDARIELDFSHERMYEDPFVSVDHGMTYDYTYSTCFVTPINRVCMCKPLPMTEEWPTTVTGLYVRKKKADFTGLSSSWAESSLQTAGNWYLTYTGGPATHNRYLTTEVYEANPSMYVAFGSFNSGNERLKVWEFGFMGPLSSTSPVLQFDIWSNGRVFVYRYGVLIKKGSLGSFRGAKPNTTSEVADYGEGAEDMPSETNVADMPSERNFIDLLILAGMENELLLLTNSGEGFDVEFDLAEGEDLIPAGSRFYFRPFQGYPTVQIANCNFKDSAIVYTKPSVAYAPMTRERRVELEYFATTVSRSGYRLGTITESLVTTDFLNAWEPDSVSDRFRTKIVLTSNVGQTRTPFLYANQTTIHGRLVPTPNEPFDLTPYIKTWKLKASSDGTYSKLTCNLINVDGFLEAYGLTSENILQIPKSMTPITLKINNIPIFVGAIMSFSITSDSHQPTLETAVVECLDSSFLLANQMLSDNIPLDGLELGAAFGRLCENYSYIKKDPSMNLLTRNGGNYTITPRSTPSKGDFGFKLERGDTPAEGIDKLGKTFLIGGMWFIFPLYYQETNTYREVFYAYTRYQVPFTRRPPKKIYRSIDEAKKVYMEKACMGDFYLNVQYEFFPALANQVIVTGRSSHNSTTPAQAVLNDYASQWPGWLKAERPDNWKGMVVKYGHYKSELVGIDLITDCAYIVFDEVTVTKAKLSCETFEPVMGGSDDSIPTPYWLGDQLWLQGWGTFMIRELEMNGIHFPQNTDPTKPDRICEIRTVYSGYRTAPPEGVAYDAHESSD